MPSLNTKLATAPNTSSNYVLKATTSTTIGNSLIFDNGTSLFIGNGQSSATPQVGIIEGTDGSGTNIAGAEFRIQGGQGTGTGVGGAVTFYTAAAGSTGSSLNTAVERMRVTNAGLVGIATTSPSARLDVRVPLEVSPVGAVALIAGTSNGVNDIFRWFDGTTQLGVFKNSGNVGIGTSSPSYLLDVNGTGRFNGKITSTVGNNNLIIENTSATTGWIQALRILNTGGHFGLWVEDSSGNNRASGSLAYASGLCTYTSTALQFGTNNAIRMSITNDGRVCINTTAKINEGRFNIVDDCNTTTPIEIKDTASNPGGAYMLRFVNNSNVVCGSIAHQTSTTTQYNTSSDYRLKTDLKDYNGLDVVSKIKTYDFKWIEDNNRMYGVLAHELFDIMPYAVNGEKDGEQMQGVDYSKLVPVLVKAIQEQQKQIEELKQLVK